VGGYVNEDRTLPGITAECIEIKYTGEDVIYSNNNIIEISKIYLDNIH
jgi:hypothetical protein